MCDINYYIVKKMALGSKSHFSTVTALENIFCWQKTKDEHVQLHKGVDLDVII